MNRFGLYLFLYVLHLLLQSNLLFSQVEIGDNGFVLNIPNIPKNLDILEVGNRISSFPGIYINDHSIIYNPKEKKWHMYGIINGEKSFIHLTADSLTQRNWIEHKNYVDSGAKIWAPHIIYEKGKYFMFYTKIGVPRQIVCVESADLWSWSNPKLILASRTRSGTDAKNKDPMVLKDRNQWIMYFSMMKDSTKWVVGYSTSSDLKKWSKPQICFDENTSMPRVESPFVVKRGDYYYIFISARPWPYGYMEVFRSSSPYSWKITDKVKWMDWHAPEIIRDTDGMWYITLCGYEPERNGFSVWPLYWNDYLDDAETSVPVPKNNINLTPKSYAKQTSFHPAQIWFDTYGTAINAHGGGVIFFEGIYYWYGEHKLKGKSEATFADGGIHCYSSVNLIDWKDEGIVLSVDYKDEKNDLAYGCILERPKIVFNEKNKQFVVYFKLYLKGVGYETSYVGVAVADKPNGPFMYHHKFHGGGSSNGSGDFSMFKDENGNLYHLTVRKPDKTFVIGKMDVDYYYPVGEYQVCDGISLHTEAPVVIKRDGVYHLLSSGSSGWKPNAARYFTTDSLLGKWSYQGNPCLGFNNVDNIGVENTFGGQSSFIFAVQGKKDAYIAMFDIWRPENPITGRYIWLPVKFKNDKMSVSWYESWSSDVFKSGSH